MRHELNRFNWIAPFYDKLGRAVFGSTLKDSQLTFLSHIKSTDSVLIVGGGAGELLICLLEIYPHLNICYVEASSQMIHLAKKKIPTPSNVIFIHGTHADIPLSKFHFVITNFVLDLFSEKTLAAVVETISGRINENGKWIVTDFENSPRRSHKFLLSMMYLFFRVTKSIEAKCLPDWRRQLQLREFKVANEKSFANGLIKSTLLARN